MRLEGTNIVEIVRSIHRITSRLRLVVLWIFITAATTGLLADDQLPSVPNNDAIPVSPAVFTLPLDATPADTGEGTARSEPQPNSPPPDAPIVEIPALVSPPTAGVEPSARVPVTKADIQSRVKQLDEAPGIDETLKAELTKRYQAALDWLTAADEASNKAKQYEQDADQAPQLVQRAKEQLAQTPTDQPILPQPDASLTQLDQQRAQAEAEATEARESLKRLEDEIQRRGERKSELAKLTEETRQRLADAEMQLQAPGPAGEDGEVAHARRIESDARIQMLQGQLGLYRAEARRSDARAELLPLLRDLDTRQLNFREKQVATWQQIVAQRRKEESERQAIAARRQVQVTIPSLREIAEQNSALAESRKEISDRLTSTATEVQQTKVQLERTKSQFQQAREKVEKAGHSTIVGLMLRKLHDQVPSVLAYQRDLRVIREEIPRIDLSRMEYDELRADLADVDAHVAKIVAALPEASTGSTPNTLESAARELLTAKRDLLDDLVREHDQYLETLSQLEINHQDLIEQTTGLRAYIDEHVLWIRSAERLSLTDFQQVTQAVTDLASPRVWLSVARSVRRDIGQRPLRTMVVALLLLLTLGLQTRLLRRLKQICTPKSGNVMIHLGPTVGALLLAAIARVPAPAALLFVGRRLVTSDQPTEIGYALGQSLVYGAVVWWSVSFMRLICRSEGVGETHFDWAASDARLVRIKLWWLTIIGLPLAVGVVFTSRYQTGEWAESLGRLAFIALMGLLMAFFHSLLGTRDHVLREFAAKYPAGWVARMRGIVHFCGVVLPLVLAVLAAVGYYYSAQQLALRLQMTLALVMSLVLIHSVVTRWFLVKRRALSIQQFRQRQQLQQLEQSGDLNDLTSMNTPTMVGQQQDLAAIHGQLRMLLRHAALVAMLVGGWFIWSGVLPALKILDRVEFWRSTVEVAESYEGPDGLLANRSHSVEIVTTLRHGVVALLVLTGTFILGRNLPALLEITILNRLPFDKGGRHAISVLTRYMVGLTGVLLACRTMSISWSSVQWLAAAITFGLGFGLQEIFANFVSGVILLFERPIRLGDVITLGDVTGTVTDIRIRATTVTDWDRKELIVPNKELITGRLLNWTLSDTMNRLVINVGVAYKSDPDETRQLLLDTVKSHPNVLKDPEPNVVFDLFGESTLNFAIKAYLASLDVRLMTKHELHTAIYRRLTEAGIDIAFPQRDINIHFVDRPVEEVMSRTIRRAA